MAKAKTKAPLPFIDEEVAQTNCEPPCEGSVVPTDRKLTPSELKDQKIQFLEQENTELKELVQRNFEEIRQREQEYYNMRNFYMKRLKLVADTISFMKDALITDTKGEQ